MPTAQIKLQMQMCNLRSHPGWSTDHQRLGKGPPDPAPAGLQFPRVRGLGSWDLSEVNMQPRKPRTRLSVSQSGLTDTN